MKKENKIETVQMEYVKVPFKDLIPYANNPRINDAAIPAVETSIEQVGYITPIVVNESNVILAGHTRYRALYNLAMDDGEIEVIRVTGATPDDEKKFRLLDNKTGEFAKWDLDLLMEELDTIDLEDFEWFGEEIEQAAEKEVKEAKEKKEKVQKPVICPRCGKIVKGGGSDLDIMVGDDE